MSTEVIQDKPVVVRAIGDIDLYNVAEFRKALDETAEMSPDGFIIDLSETTYIDSAGVQAILAVYVKVDANKGRLALVAGNPRIKSVLEVVHLEMLPRMCVYNDLHSAKEMIKCESCRSRSRQ
jgi:anti-sigma B factor antagonist